MTSLRLVALLGSAVALAAMALPRAAGAQTLDSRNTTCSIQRMAPVPCGVEAVDDAISDQVTSIVVPDTSYELHHTSLEPLNNDAVTFSVNTGSGLVDMTAGRRQGTLDGQVPRTQAEAQLLIAANATCEVAFGDG